MDKKEIKEFNKKLIEEIGDDSLLQDIFGLTMGGGENFWCIYKDDMAELFKKLRDGFQ